MIMRCPSCEMISINGIPFHETGCPDAWRDYDRKCLECYSKFKPEYPTERFCSHSCSIAYRGYTCDCEECHASE